MVAEVHADRTILPMVSVGMPVYNGARYLARALDTLLAQRFENFDLIISDNASSDQTPQICEHYAAVDRRVRYFRAAANRGASWNFNHVLELASAEMFVWAAHDDEWHPDFLERCVGVLRQEPGVVACYSQYQLVDDRGVAQGGLGGIGCEGASRRERWNRVLRHWGVHAAIYAVMRTAAAKRTRGVLPCLSSDLVFMSELLLHGELVMVPGALHRKQLAAGGAYRSPEEVLRAISTKRQRPWLFHRFGVLREELAGLRHAKLHPDEERALARDAWVHYVTSRSWLYDGVECARRILGEHGAQG
jgi:glycosyltransferase involved in cell wall biosynthesis